MLRIIIYLDAFPSFHVTDVAYGMVTGPGLTNISRQRVAYEYCLEKKSKKETAWFPN